MPAPTAVEVITLSRPLKPAIPIRAIALASATGPVAEARYVAVIVLCRYWSRCG